MEAWICVCSKLFHFRPFDVMEKEIERRTFISAFPQLDVPKAQYLLWFSFLWDLPASKASHIITYAILGPILGPSYAFILHKMNVVHICLELTLGSKKSATQS